MAMDLMPNIGQGSVFGYETKKSLVGYSPLLFHENNQT